MHNLQSYYLINEILSSYKIIPEVFFHNSVYTCEQADKYVPNPEYGIKSILLKGKNDCFIVVVPGNKRVSFLKIKNFLNEKRVSFAKESDLDTFVGSERGAVPPFGHLQKIPILVDISIRNFQKIYFNPGINSITYGIKSDDFMIFLKNIVQFTDLIE